MCETFDRISFNKDIQRKDLLRDYLNEHTDIAIEYEKMKLKLWNETTLGAVRKTYPNYKMEIIRQFEGGETVISEFVMRGTHKPV